VVDDEQIRLRGAHPLTQFFELAAAYKGARVRLIPGRFNRLDHVHVRRSGKLHAFGDGGGVIDQLTGLSGGRTEMDMKNDCFAAGFWTIKKQDCSCKNLALATVMATS
jgi:hypothetical protein